MILENIHNILDENITNRKLNQGIKVSSKSVTREFSINGKKVPNKFKSMKSMVLSRKSKDKLLQKSEC